MTNPFPGLPIHPSSVPLAFSPSLLKLPALGVVIMQWLKAEPFALKVSVLPRPQEAVVALKAKGHYIMWVEEHTQTHWHVPRVVVLIPQELSW